MDYVLEILPNLVMGLKVTVQLFVWTLVLSLPLGLPLAIGSDTRFWPIKGLCKLYILVFRGTPLLLQLMFFHYGIPIMFNVTGMDPLTSGVVTFVLNYAAYFAEIYRGGINSIDHGQYEAAHALGIPKTKTFFDIIVPQALRVVLPSIGNEAIVLVKDTALVSTITVMELLQISKGMVNRDGVLTAYLIAAILYLCLTLILTFVEGKIEKKCSKYQERSN